MSWETRSRASPTQNGVHVETFGNILAGSRPQDTPNIGCLDPENQGFRPGRLKCQFFRVPGPGVSWRGSGPRTLKIRVLDPENQGFHSGRLRWQSFPPQAARRRRARRARRAPGPWRATVRSFIRWARGPPRPPGTRGGAPRTPKSKEDSNPAVFHFRFVAIRTQTTGNVVWFPAPGHAKSDLPTPKTRDSDPAI